MKFISLFSGIGGFDLAFDRAGMECVTVCEIDKNAQAILRRHFPNATLYDDVRKVGKETHERKSIDLICGGFPCQDLSVAGKRAGLAGERSGLWFEFARVIDELEPRWVVIENVPGLLSSHKGKDFAIVVRWLAERGYGVTWRVLDAQYFGVPQRRRRVFIVGSFGNGCSAEVLFERDGLQGNPPPSRKTGKDIAYSLRSNPSHSGDKGDGGINTTLINLANSGANQNNVKVTETMDTLDTWSSFAVMAHGQANAEIVSDGSPSLTRNHEAPILFSSKDNGRDAGFISPTLRSMSHDKSHANGGGQVAITSSSGIRRLTPTECERLQGFPDGWTDGQSDTTRYRQLGNAVAVPVVEWIGKRIMKAENVPNTAWSRLVQGSGILPAVVNQSESDLPA